VSESTRSRTPRKPKKPAKPYEDFPLFPHATKRWAKKIRGKMHYFGPWDDWKSALAKYQEQKDDLHAGRTPRVRGEGFTVRDLVNRFLTFKRHQLTTREITPRTFKDYYATCERFVTAFGLLRLVSDLAADDFEMLHATLAKTMGVVSLGNEIQRVRVVFKYADDAALIDRVPRYGPGFKKPSRKSLRLARAARGKRMFEAAELRKLLDRAGRPLRVVLLLGINCGLGNTDIGRLPLSGLDLDRGWLDYPRVKTGVPRRCPLWPETVKAIRAHLAKRPKAKNPADDSLAVLTRGGKPWVKVVTSEGGAEEGAPPVTVRFDDCIAKEVAKLLKELGIARPGLNFYALRHTFETVGGGCRDQVAVNSIMGHVDESMAAGYCEEVGDDRLKVVTDHVRGWLFPPATKKPKGEKEGATGGSGARNRPAPAG
jgi:integrase